MQFKSTALLVSTLFSVCLHVIVLTTNDWGFGNSVQVNRPSAVNVSIMDLHISKFEQKKTTHMKSSNLQSYDIALPKTIKQVEPVEQSTLQTVRGKSDQFTNEITENSEKILSTAIEAQTSSPASTGGSNSVISNTTGLVPTPLPVPLSMLLTWPANLKQDVHVRLESYWKDGKLELKMMESSGNPAFDAYAQAYAQYQLDNATTELAQQQYYFTLTR